jgi:hypothetical protein
MAQFNKLTSVDRYRIPFHESQSVSVQSVFTVTSDKPNPQVVEKLGTHYSEFEFTGWSSEVNSRLSKIIFTAHHSVFIADCSFCIGSFSRLSPIS